MSSTEHAPGLFIRGFTPPLRLADYRLIAFDMDSTLINIECVDEIAAEAGRKAEVAEITEAALQRVYEQRLQLNPGAEALVRACQAAGLKTLLVSGGFTFFSERVRQR